MKAARKYLGIAQLSLLNAVQYPANLASRFIFYTLFISVFFCLWQAIYQGGEVNGYSFIQMIWYLCFTELIVYCCRSTIYNQMNEDIKTGSIAYLLTRPCHYVFYQFFSALGEILVSFALFGSFAVLLAFLYVGPLPMFAFWQLPAIVLSILLGVTINFFLLLILGLSAFIWEENMGLYFVYQKLIFMLGMFMPVEFLPTWLQGIAKLMPFSYVAWAPARLLVSFSWEFFWQVLPIQLFWAICAIASSLWLYRFSVRFLQGQGG